MTTSPEDSNLWRRIVLLEERIATLERVDRLNAASIGAGGLRVRNGGSITIEGGDLVIKDAGGTTVATLATSGLELSGGP